MKPEFTYKASVVRVVDGDTIDLMVDLGFNIRTQIRTRLYGLNAPEVSTLAGRNVRDAVSRMLPPAFPCVVRTFKDPTDKYGRWLAVIEVTDQGTTVNLNSWLVANNMAKEYIL